MLNYLKLVCIVTTICLHLRTSNASLIGNLLGTVGNLLVPGGINSVGENAKLCSLDTPGITAYYGYNSDTLSVTTADGYILTVYCVYNSTLRNSSLNPVIVWHGLMDASHSYVLNYPNQSLAFNLANDGYYVCLANARGNGFSQGYVNNSRNSNNIVDPYWQFSLDQIATYDAPAVIDAVLDQTGKSKVIYVGHSQGTTIMFALLSSNPAYNDKISIFAAMAPVAYFDHSTSPVFLGASDVELLLDGLYGSQFLPHTALETLLEYIVCTLPTEALCENLIFFTLGYSTHLDESRLPVFLCHSPSDFSWGQFLHYVQLQTVNQFQKFDFKSQNQQIYGQSTPPQYDVTKITAPVALFYSDADIVADSTDVQTLKPQLRNLIYEQRLNASINFSHVDYVWGKDVYQIVYATLINLIKGY